ncbi:MAG: hypothetical protein ACRDFB_08200 [Rhabdochlamydiaceae bacterium]
MSSTNPPRVFTFPEAQTICLKAFNYVLNFAKGIHVWVPSAGFAQPITEFETLISKIQHATGPFLTQAEYDGYLKPLLDKIVLWRPEVANQLLKFWDAQIKVGKIATADTSKPQYNPMAKAINAIEEMAQASAIYLRATDKVVQYPKERLFLYALFHSHVLRTESIEYAIRKDFEALINQFNLQTQYDICEIFSVGSKIQNGPSSFSTDARAIRDAFGHFQYKITDVGTSWEIEFLTTRPGFVYNKKFTATEFLTLMENTDLLYKSILYLIWLYVGSAVVSNVFII